MIISARIQAGAPVSHTFVTILNIRVHSAGYANKQQNLNGPREVGIPWPLLCSKLLALESSLKLNKGARTFVAGLVGFQSAVLTGA